MYPQVRRDNINQRSITHGILRWGINGNRRNPLRVLNQFAEGSISEGRRPTGKTNQAEAKGNPGRDSAVAVSVGQGQSIDVANVLRVEWAYAWNVRVPLANESAPIT